MAGVTFKIPVGCKPFHALQDTSIPHFQMPQHPHHQDNRNVLTVLLEPVTQADDRALLPWPECLPVLVRGHKGKCSHY